MMVIIDYGLGNISAFANLYRVLNVPVKVAKTASDLADATHIILPGVGAFDHAMNLFNASGMRSAVEDRVLGAKVPVLGICVGMQMLARSSEEGVLPGLGWIAGEVVKFRGEESVSGTRLPHMGWNDIRFLGPNRLFSGLPEGSQFYFLHSYHFNCDSPQDSLATCNYKYDFCCATARDNIYGVQFHPEKSHSFGMNLLKNFSEL